MEQVFAGVGGKPQLRKQHQRRLALRRRQDHLHGLKAVEGRVGDLNRGKGNRDPDEVMIVEVEELVAGFHELVLRATILHKFHPSPTFSFVGDFLCTLSTLCLAGDFS